MFQNQISLQIYYQLPQKSTKHLNLHNEMGIFPFVYTYAPSRIFPGGINSEKGVLLLYYFNQLVVENHLLG